MTKTILLLAVCLLARQIRAQGTIYVSNLNQPSSGSVPVASDSWRAAEFVTGPNPMGYLLTSVQLRIDSATGMPGNFKAMLYEASAAAPLPYFNVSPLSFFGSVMSAGGYTENLKLPGILLYPNVPYFIVLTAIPYQAGAYEWSQASTGSFSQSGGWYAGADFVSSDGSLWWPTGPSHSQFAITAWAIPPIPEPSLLWLLLLGSGLLAVSKVRKAAHQ